MKLCIDHKLELWKRGYGPAAVLAMIPTAYCQSKCDVCNGTFQTNQDRSKKEMEKAVQCFMPMEEFLKDEKTTDDFKFTEKELREMEEEARESQYKRDRDWSMISGWVVGEEPID